MTNEMKDCPIVVDLLPLYLEEKISRESAVFVQNHLETCDNCRKECLWMQTSFMNKPEKEKSWNGTSEVWKEQTAGSAKRRDVTGRKPSKLFSVAKQKLLLYGYLLLLTIVVVYCIANFIAW